ncbi:MAG: DUF86 domain-containing protein [Candidatus Omnitrophota bacterium]
MKRAPELYIADIVTSIKKIEKYTKDMLFEEFKKDDKTVDSVIRNLEVIGEAAKNLKKHCKDIYPDIPWQVMISMRNKVIHEYFGIDLSILWSTIKYDIPHLKRNIVKLK